ncbi:hypothetical protein [Sphingomonas crusticola]|uniref:hypothetical protein n=1 Tax=Sphingomonas crusticola TaxID=1697973 RepID=UPI000E259AC3|nr:hypothetical protein [Sphingomonas crusticola]
MKKLIVLPLIAITALGLSACTSKTENTNVTVNDTSADLNATDLNATDLGATDNAVDATLDNGSNTSDALTNG